MSTDTALQELDFRVPRPDSLMQRQADEFLLLREMHHRVANTLTVLTSVLRRELAPYPSAEFQKSLVRCEARIVAFGNLHRCLVVGSAHHWVSVQCYVEHLCEALSVAILEPLGVRCEVIADAGEFLSERCERLGLIIAELVTNAAKHAFNGRNDGLVRVELIDNNEFLVCMVSDNGDGAKISSFGAGSEILKQLVRALGGRLVRTSDCKGTSVMVTCRR